MDRKRFDALTRLLAAEGSRRSALGAALGAAFLGGGPGVGAKKKNRKKKKKNPPWPCFGTKDCPFPSDGQDFEDCNLAGAVLGDCNGCNFRDADLGGANLAFTSYQGASFREANLRDADLEDADVSGASFRDACLVNANFFGANTDGAHFGDAILCNTILSDGSVDNSGCDKVTSCCPATAVECVKDADCPGGDVCIGGVCVAQNPTCAADPDACNDGFNICGDLDPTVASGVCYCYPSTESGSRCVNINNLTNPNCAGRTCDDSSDCEPGEFCAVLNLTATCCAAKLCGRECPEFGAAARGNGREVAPPQR